MELFYSEALGHLLASYYKELKYIIDFKDKVKNNVEIVEISSDYNLYKYLIDFNVIRNINDGKKSINKFYSYFIGSYNNSKNNLNLMNKNNIVNNISNLLKATDLTRNQEVISLSSKVLFLLHPTEIYPYDSLAKKALRINDTNKAYNEYYIAANTKLKEKKDKVSSELSRISNVLDGIEDRLKNDNISFFQDNEFDFETYRLKRYFDKLLWTVGKYNRNI